MSNRHADSESTLIDLLGGTSVVADLFGVGDPAVSLWRSRGFPAWTHTRFVDICNQEGITYDPALLRAEPRGRREVAP